MCGTPEERLLMPPKRGHGSISITLDVYFIPPMVMTDIINGSMTDKKNAAIAMAKKRLRGPSQEKSVETFVEAVEY
jgi:hypothetical protein